jgi:hypothetical protein
MGTSQSSNGSPSGVPMVPPWVPAPDAPPEPPADAGDTDQPDDAGPDDQTSPVAPNSPLGHELINGIPLMGEM